LAARSFPLANTLGRSLLATSVRAMLTASQSLFRIALSITEAVWKPPVQITGTFTAGETHTSAVTLEAGQFLRLS